MEYKTGIVEFTNETPNGTSQTVKLGYVKSGKVVTLHILQMVLTPKQINTAIALNGTLPEELRPAGNRFFSSVLCSNGSIIGTARISISANGTINYISSCPDIQDMYFTATYIAL